jgi:hypothetical protein
MAEISAARYNNLQARVAGIMSKGAGDEGYGQALQSYQVGQGDTVLAEHMNKLYQDIRRARIHQTGSIPSEIAEVAANSDVVEDSNTTTKKGLAQYEAISLDVVADRLTVATGQAAIENQAAATSFTDTNWNGTIRHDVTVTFNAYTITNADGSKVSMSAADAARVYFNAGGEILFTPGLAADGTGGSITRDWRNLINAVGTVRFRRSNTTNAAYPNTSGGSGGTNLGYVDMNTGSWQTIYTKNASSYSTNDYTIQARLLNTSNIAFRIYFNDDKGPNPNFDEAVTPRTTSTTRIYRPNNSSSVNVNAPTCATTRALS